MMPTSETSSQSILKTICSIALGKEQFQQELTDQAMHGEPKNARKATWTALGAFVAPLADEALRANYEQFSEEIWQWLWQDLC